MKSPKSRSQAPDREKLGKSLQRDIRQFQLQRDILKKTSELLRKDLGVDRVLLSNREKTLLVDALKQTFALSDFLLESDLARSSYFYHRARLRIFIKHVAARVLSQKS